MSAQALRLYGTGQPVEPAQPLRAGPLTLALQGGWLRRRAGRPPHARGQADGSPSALLRWHLAAAGQPVRRTADCAARNRVRLAPYAVCIHGERSPRGVELTPAGASLLPHARALLVEINQMQADMRDHAAGSKGALRILANPSVITEAQPDDLASFGKAHPDVRLIVGERWSDEIVRSLIAAESDVGIVVEGVATDGLDTFPYRTDRLAMVLRADHALARPAARVAAPTVAFHEVLDNDLVRLEPGSSMMRLLAQQTADVGAGLLLAHLQRASTHP